MINKSCFDLSSFIFPNWLFYWSVICSNSFWFCCICLICCDIFSLMRTNGFPTFMNFSFNRFFLQKFILMPCFRVHLIFKCVLVCLFQAWIFFVSILLCVYDHTQSKIFRINWIFLRFCKQLADYYVYLWLDLEWTIRCSWTVRVFVMFDMLKVRFWAKTWCSKVFEVRSCC